MTSMTDFPEEVLRAMLGAVVFKKETLKDYIRKIEEYQVSDLLCGKVREYESEIERLLTAEIQVATALVTVSARNKAILN